MMPIGEEPPRQERGPAGLDEPSLAEPAGGQRRDGEGERHREADVAQVEHRRVDGHEDVLLQERVGAGPVVARRDGHGRERVGRAEHQQEEEEADDEHRQQREADERVGQPAAELAGDVDGEAGEDQRPQEDRALERRPHRRHVEQRRRAARAVVVDEADREVAGDQRPLHGDDGDHRAEQHEQAVAPAGLEELGPLLAEADGEGDDAEGGGGHAEDDRRRCRGWRSRVGACRRSRRPRRRRGGPRCRPRTPRSASRGSRSLIEHVAGGGPTGPRARPGCRARTARAGRRRGRPAPRRR